MLHVAYQPRSSLDPQDPSQEKNLHGDRRCGRARIKYGVCQEGLCHGASLSLRDACCGSLGGGLGYSDPRERRLCRRYCDLIEAVAKGAGDGTSSQHAGNNARCTGCV